ncbi:MAG: hypothetical protein HFG75_10305 [Hungatella sp.]|nr:hypothetical protein [Hungatella sp.]
MSDNGKKNKLIMVNSFKGGTGKTSVALSQCIYNWKMSSEGGGENYQDIFFVDIDRLGTSLAYSLFLEKDRKAIHYFDEYPEKTFDIICNEVNLGEQSGNKLYAVLLNPVAKRKQDYMIRGRLQQHEVVKQDIFIERLLSFIKKCINTGERSLFVVDCSPGLSDLERGLLEEFYRLKGEYSLLIEEIYVTTFDASQIRKTIECLNDCFDYLHKGTKRDVSIVLNDLHNCQGLSRDKDTIIFDWEDTAKKILDKLKDRTGVKIRFKQYESGQLKSCIIENERHISNNTNSYTLQQEYRNGYISIEQVEGQ